MNELKKQQKKGRVSLLSGSLLILFAGIVFIIPIEKNLISYVQVMSPEAKVAGTSIFAEVPVTQENTLARQLKEKQQELDEKEANLKAKEAYFAKNFAPTPGTIRTLYFILAVLGIMLMLNFILDYKRNKKAFK